jgi:hypothetical protein
MKLPSHVRDLRDRIVREGFEFLGVEHTRGGHLRVTVSKGPNTAKFIIPATPSEGRGALNRVADIRRHFRAFA